MTQSNNRPSTSQNNVLYEIAISIGNTNNLEPMLKESLTTLMRKLDGIAVAIVERKLDGSLKTLSKYPRRGFKEIFLAPLTELKFDDICFYQHKTFDDSHCYYFDLPQTGFLVFIRKNPLDEVLLKVLEPICLKLDNSIQACMAVEDLQHSEKVLSESLVQLQLAQKSKDRFLANMSHEIRTPLNGILGFINQLAQSDLNAEQKHFVEIVQNSSHTLLGVINDILDFSKIESGQFEIDEHVYNFKHEILPAVELFKVRAAEKNLAFELNVDPLLDQQLEFDNLRIKQVISNLVSNSIKFTSSGTIAVDIKVIDKTHDNLVTEFSVNDTGIGIAKEHLSKIFSPFLQADKSTTRKHGGTGLGLSISKELVKLMGGNLQVESTLNQGTRFFFTLSLKASKQNSQSTETNWQFIHGDYRVLLVEDNKVNQLLMQAILKQLNLKFDLAQNGVEAIEQFKNNTYDLILMDINMPIMDGITSFHVIQQMYQEEAFSFTPVVALTANALVGDCEKYMATGMQDCLKKPLEMNELQRVLVQQLNQRKTPKCQINEQDKAKNPNT